MLNAVCVLKAESLWKVRIAEGDFEVEMWECENEGDSEDAEGAASWTLEIGKEGQRYVPVLATGKSSVCDAPLSTAGSYIFIQ